MVKVDALQVHLKSLSSEGAMLPLYVFSGDEPLLMMEAMDQLRIAACLLYTSPSPRDRTRSRMPSSA